MGRGGIRRGKRRVFFLLSFWENRWRKFGTKMTSFFLEGCPPPRSVAFPSFHGIHLLFSFFFFSFLFFLIISVPWRRPWPSMWRPRVFAQCLWRRRRCRVSLPVLRISVALAVVWRSRTRTTRGPCPRPRPSPGPGSWAFRMKRRARPLRIRVRWVVFRVFFPWAARGMFWPALSFFLVLWARLLLMVLSKTQKKGH